MKIFSQTSSKHNVREKVLIPLSLTFIVLIVSFVWACYGILRADERLLLQLQFSGTQNLLKGLLTEENAILTSTAEFIASNEQLQKAILLQDADGLRTFSTPLLGRLSSQLDITHFYYYDQKGKLLLRVYFPEDISQPKELRKTLRHAMASGQVVAGLEIGRHGTFAQRLVFPWYKDGILIGYIELGVGLEKILEKLKQITQVELAITIDKKNVDPNNWESYTSRQQGYLPWDFLADKLISDSTIKIPKEFASKALNAPKYGPLEDELHIDQKTYRGALLVVTDLEAHRVADLLILIDTTGHKSTFYGLLFWAIGFSLLLSSALFGFAFRILGRVGQQLTHSEECLQQERVSLVAANHKLLSEIEAREQTEQQLIELNQTLEQRVADRTNELKEQNVLLEQNRTALGNAYRELKEKQAAILHQDKMSCIGQLAAGIAHDINNPVGFVSHNMVLFERYFQQFERFFCLQQELIKSLASDEIKAGWKKSCCDFKVEEIFEEIPVMLEECRDGTTRITQIVQGLRTFIRNETPKYQLTDLHLCLKSTLSMLRYELKGKVQVVFDFGDIPKLNCYPQQMNQLFMNLFLNACQAIDGTGEIRVRTRERDKQIIIVISDTGYGISQEALGKIYEPFFSTKPIGLGTGLGLSIVYEIVMRHHGTISVESEVGHGTSFTLTFPFTSGEDSHNVLAEAASTGRGESHG